MAPVLLYSKPNLFFLSIFITSLLQPQTTTALPDQRQDSPSPVAIDERDQGQMMLLPPTLITANTTRPRHHRNLKSLMRRKKPLYEDFLDNTQKRILESAVKNFGLHYQIFPVTRGSEYDATSSPEDEADLVRAFELLCGIVGRSVRDAITCSSDREDSPARKETDCDGTDDVVIYFNKDKEDDEDTLCSPNDPENLLSEECKTKIERKQSRIKVIRGPAIGFTMTVYSTSNSGDSVSLPVNGGLKDALDHRLWKADVPTKIILTLVPFEFIRAPRFIEKINRKIVSAFMKKYGVNEPHNIVLVEWPEIAAKQTSITQLATSYLATAEKLARIILRWHRKLQVHLDKIHLIGTSIGAHLAGVIGKIIKERTAGQQISRITGLDPIGWGFDEMDDGYGVDREVELSKDDAEFVDVIHTSASDPHFPYIHYGSNEKRGTVDFYPNNGRAQYCGKTDGLCHHFYSVILYTASIAGANFNGCKCSSWDDFIMKQKCFPCTDAATMGEHVDRGKASGVYYLATA